MLARPLVFAMAGLMAVATASEAQEIALRPLVEGFERPVALAHAGDGSGRLFVAEQTGRVWVLAGEGALPTLFLDLSSLVSCCGERGLLGLAFHPDYEVNGWLFLNTTDLGGGTRVVRYTVSSDPNVADPGSAVSILSFAQPFSNHNGGQLAFGPAGKLWIGVGDGGSAGDPTNNAQSSLSLLGKILRIDVDGGLPYEIPVDNPFRFDALTRGEIWALGLRNPWRFSFDRMTGDLLVADVGQDDREEVNFEPVTSAGGRNYGWRRMEGTLCFQPATGCNDGSLVLPVLEYSHDEGCSITGGYRYRGLAMPGLFGVYVFGDFCSGVIWGAAPDETGLWTRRVLLASDLRIASFGEEERGELYVADLGGSVFRIERGSPPSGGENPTGGRARPSS